MSLECLKCTLPICDEDNPGCTFVQIRRADANERQREYRAELRAKGKRTYNPATLKAWRLKRKPKHKDTFKRDLLAILRALQKG
jgi:hypothetical protein